MRILFSPVGANDPYSLREAGAAGASEEGSLLTVLRGTKPDAVHLFYNVGVKDAMEQAALDTKDIIAADFPAIKIEFLPQEGFAEPHIYDAVYSLLDNALSAIRLSEPRAELILNVSSGTPAIKAALIILHTLDEYRTIAYQVSDRGDERLIRLEKYHSLFNEIVKQNIVVLINNYDYEGALKILPRQSSLDSGVQERIEKCLRRQKLQDASDGKELLFCHIENMAVLLKKQRYSEFLMSINPIRDEFIQLFSGRQINPDKGMYNSTLVYDCIDRPNIQNSLKSLINKEQVVDHRNKVAHYVGEPPTSLSYTGVLSGKCGYRGVLEELRALYEKLYKRPRWNSYDASNQDIIKLL